MKFASMGGKATAKNMTKKQRSEKGKKMANRRWFLYRKAKRAVKKDKKESVHNIPTIES